MLTVTLVIGGMVIGIFILVAVLNPVVDRKGERNILWYGTHNNRKFIKL